jgi:phosphatidylglycerophosphatase A
MLPVAAFWQRVLTILLGVGLLGLGVWAATQAEKHFGRVDPGQVVIDEVVGQIITLLAWPRRSWGWVLAGFLLFRFFDIVKPFPARRVERFPQGWGIMLDDVVAGAYGLATLSLFGLVWK